MLNTSALTPIQPTKKGELILSFRGMCNIMSVGGRGSSKSFTMMLDILSHCQEFGADGRPLVLREGWAGLLELQAELFALLTTAYGQGVQRNKSDGTITLPTGAIIQFSNIGDEVSYNKLQGRSFSAIYGDECGNYSKSAWAFMMRARSNLRVGPGRRAHIHLTANPGGASHSRIQKQFLAKAPFWTPFEDEFEQMWVNVHSTYMDNPHIDQAAYRSQLLASTGGDKELADAWLEGRFAALGGGMFADVWDEAIHILPEAPTFRFASYKYRIGCDWGSSAPCVGVLLGETRKDMRYSNGLHLPAGTIIGIDETDSVIDRTNLALGNGISPSGWAEQLKYMALVENELKAVPPVIHDDARGLASETVIQLLQEAGIPAHKPRKKDRPGTWALLRQLLNNSKTGDGPGIYFTPKCRYLIETIPEAPRSTLAPNDIDPKYDCDHGLDALGYGVRELKTNRARYGRIKAGDY